MNVYQKWAGRFAAYRGRILVIVCNCVFLLLIIGCLYGQLQLLLSPTWWRIIVGDIAVFLFLAATGHLYSKYFLRKSFWGFLKRWFSQEGDDLIGSWLGKLLLVVYSVFWILVFGSRIASWLNTWGAPTFWITPLVFLIVAGLFIAMLVYMRRQMDKPAP